MGLHLNIFRSVQAGLGELKDEAFTFSHNLEARITTPISKNGFDIWECQLDSKTLFLQGGTIYGMPVFKMDNAPEFSIQRPPNEDDGSVSISPEEYANSKGKEFVVIEKRRIPGAEADFYGISRETFEANVLLRKHRNVDLTLLIQEGGFKLCSLCTESEFLVHDLWLELAVGKNCAAPTEYADAITLLKRYWAAAKERGVQDEGMEIYAHGSPTGFRAHHMYIDCDEVLSRASIGSFIFQHGYYLSEKIFEKNKTLFAR